MSGLDALMAAAPVAAAGRRATRSRLRVVAMHGVDDLGALDRQLAQLLGWFQAVDAGAVLGWLRGEPLPDRAIWVTFDDGERSTVVDAAPVLARHGVSATVFVCPGLVESAEPPWWEVVTAAVRHGLPVDVDEAAPTDQQAVTALKQVPDPRRRAIVAALWDQLGVDGLRSGGPAAEPVTVEDLRRWREMGGDVGSHTWDHPCLDRCEPDEQRRQIDAAAEWLDRHELWDRRIFAYPNGDRTDVAEAHLARTGHQLVALFDHALARRSGGPLRLSRLRLDAGASPERTAAVTSGWHSGLFALRERARGRSAPGSR